ncbi:hypothetical protein CBL_05590 [Carabus blaptoides fortunei]
MSVLKYVKKLNLANSSVLFGYERISNCAQICVRNYTPRRAVLYVPGDSERKLKKAFGLKVDCIAMDCEDGVAVNKKTTARETIHCLLNEGKPHSAKFDWAIRINSIDSGLCSDDLSAILTAKHLPDTILLPKVEHTQHLKWFSEQLKKHLKKDKYVNLVMLIESAVSMLNLPDICKMAQEHPLHFVPTSLIFGSDDFCASIGATRTEDSTEILYARQKMVLVAKAYGLQAIDMVYINYKDLDGLQKQCEQGMRMGYTGKQVIHPEQVPITQVSFLPTKAHLHWATGLLEAFDKHQKSGVGAFTYKGSMIDMPTVRQAQNVMKLMESAKNEV